MKCDIRLNYATKPNDTTRMRKRSTNYDVVLSTGASKFMRGLHDKDPTAYGQLVQNVLSLETGPIKDDLPVRYVKACKGKGRVYYGISKTCSGAVERAYLVLDAKRTIVLARLKPVLGRLPSQDG